MLPAIPCHEIAEHDEERWTADETAGFGQRPAKVGRSVRRALRGVVDPGDQLQQRSSAGRWRNDGANPLVEEQRAHPVAAPDQQLPDDRRELERQLALEAACRSPIQRSGDVDQQPGIEATLGKGLTDVGPVRPRRDVPLDGPRVIARLILPDIRVLQAGAPKR